MSEESPSDETKLPLTQELDPEELGVEEPAVAPEDIINIRNISIKCGHCDTYQTLCAYERRDDWNVYTYECENDTCDPQMTRTLLEVPADLDAFARRDPTWRGGKRHSRHDDD